MATEEKVKAVKKLTVEECLAELKELAKDVEFDVKFTKKTPLKELQALVKEGRDALASDEESDESEGKDLGGKDESSDTDSGKSDDGSGKDSEDSDEEDSEESDESTETKEVVSKKTIVVPGTRRGEDSITVIVTGGENRTYALSIQGDKWVTLAEQYAEHMRLQKFKVVVVKK